MAAFERPAVTGMDLDRRWLIFYLVTVWLGIACWLLPFASRVSRDNPQILGLYSPGYALLLGGLGMLVVGIPALLIYLAQSTGPVRFAATVAEKVWGRRLVYRSAAAMMGVVFVAGVAQIPQVLVRFSFTWIPIALFGFGILCYATIAFLLAPDLIAARPLLSRLDARTRLIFVALGSIMIVLALFGTNLYATWGIIDDHGVFEFLGTDMKVRIDEFPQLLLQSEIGLAFQKTRYRPSYWFLRLTEISLWRDNVLLWQVSRLAIWTIFVACFWWLASKFVGIINALLCTLCMLTLGFWLDISTRLGTNETYAVLGLGIYAVSYFYLGQLYRPTTIENRTAKRITWGINLLAALVTMGAKENLLLLMIPTFVLVIIIAKWKRLDRITMACSFLVLAYGLFVGASVGIAILGRGSDVYANPIAPSQRLAVLGSGIIQWFSDNLAGIAIYCAIAGLLIASSYLVTRRTREDWRQASRAILSFLLVCFILLGIVLTQLVFYGGTWPVGNRYDFPGTLTLVVALVALAELGGRLAQIMTRRESARNYAALALAMALGMVILTTGYAPVYSASARNIERSHAFMGQLRAITKTLQENPDASLVMESFDPNDAEAVSSTAIFLRPLGVQNRMFLIFYPVLAEKQLSAYDRSLANTLDLWSNKGDFVRGMELFSPIREHADERCFVISFSGEPRENCVFLGTLFNSPSRAPE